ncbi:hypothetical protein [Pseudoalteromonas sp. R3]|uniref:hypothetical protein n=1 Tax=Pseudoalteromonas sp. R3 TaxID=1709477 RepID=UPI0006B5CB65|nr:hypothetical protein [Pseudoalteromonas sp. R3]AZZ96294.1 hypothetical protein ELR70_03625 [Pseudoalteromonas sp. R3]
MKYLFGAALILTSTLANADVKSIYSSLLAAKMSNQDVKIAIAGDRCGTSPLDYVRNKPPVSGIGLF